MFKKLIIVVIFFCSIHGFGQTIIVDYVFNSKYLMRKDSLADSKNKETLFSKLNFQLLNSLKYKLIHSNNKSIFFSPEEALVFDNIEFEEGVEFKNTSISSMASVTYKDFLNTHTLQREYILDKAFVIDDLLNQYKWVILPGQKKINGFNCKLAKTWDVFGVEIFAWYSDSVPIVNGPSIYHGLPGLIFQIYSENFDFELISIKYLKDNANIAFTEEGEFIKQDEFVKLLKRKLGAFNIEY